MKDYTRLFNNTCEYRDQSSHPALCKYVGEQITSTFVAYPMLCARCRLIGQVDKKFLQEQITAINNAMLTMKYLKSKNPQQIRALLLKLYSINRTEENRKKILDALRGCLVAKLVNQDQAAEITKSITRR